MRWDDEIDWDSTTIEILEEDVDEKGKRLVSLSGKWEGDGRWETHNALAYMLPPYEEIDEIIETTPDESGRMFEEG